MDNSSCDPKLIRRSGGDWLALSPESNSLKIGVVGPTAELARQVFFSSVEAWKRNLTLDGSGSQ